MLKNFPKKHLITLGIATSTVGILLATGNSQQAEANRISIEIPAETSPSSALTPTNELADSAIANAEKSVVTASLEMPLLTPPSEHPESIPSEDVSNIELEQSKEEHWNDFKIKNGDTLSRIFKRAGFNDKLIYRIFADDKSAKQLSKIRPGQTVSFSTLQSEGKPEKIKLQLDRLNSYLVTLADNGKYTFEKHSIEPEKQVAYAAGKIDSSLFLAAKTAGLDESVTMALANIFGWDVDFALDIRTGDSFNLVYEELFLDGEKIGNGKILAANFTNQDKTYKAVLYTDKQGRTHYYTPEGNSMRKEFLRSPVEFARISSHFNLRRKHPVLHKIRAHRGTDYAAGRGTPIRATGDGKVVHAGRKGGYGKAVIIKHGQKFTTLYAHMSKYGRGIRTGKKVTQGQIIGYVGSTGLASGPHLHYEFRVNGVHKNPVTVSLPKAKHIPSGEMSHFKDSTAQYLSQLETYNSQYQLASTP